MDEEKLGRLQEALERQERRREAMALISDRDAAYVVLEHAKQAAAGDPRGKVEMMTDLGVLDTTRLLTVARFLAAFAGAAAHFVDTLDRDDSPGESASDRIDRLLDDALGQD